MHNLAILELPESALSKNRFWGITTKTGMTKKHIRKMYNLAVNWILIVNIFLQVNNKITLLSSRTF